jgi:hypothetical protein
MPLQDTIFSYSSHRLSSETATCGRCLRRLVRSFRFGRIGKRGHALPEVNKEEAICRESQDMTEPLHAWWYDLPDNPNGQTSGYEYRGKSSDYQEHLLSVSFGDSQTDQCGSKEREDRKEDDRF